VRRPILIGALVGVVLIGGAGVTFAATRNSAGHYRTAEATVGDANSTLALSGTMAASSRRDLTFGTSGTVAKVSISAGEEVKAGDVLVELDPTDLDADLTKAEESLAKAEAQLESDRSAQSSTVSVAASSSKSSSSAAQSSRKGANAGADTKALAELKAQQDAVLAAQTAATEAIAAAKDAVAARAEACADATDADADADDPPADTGEADADNTSQTGDQCAEALTAAQDAQDLVAERQDVLQAALDALAKTLTGAIASLATSGSSGGASSSSAGSSSSSPSGGSGGSGGSSVSAADLAKDQAQIDTAEAALKEAQIARQAASLTAPFDGTVLDVSVEKGDDVSSTDVAAIVVGDGGSTVTTTVTLDQITQVEIGQQAQVVPAGFDEAVEGEVTAIGMLPTTGDSSTTYPVTIDLADDVSAPEGAGAGITLITGTEKDAVTVPSSAVTTDGGRSTVTVLKDGAPTQVSVTVGVVGSTRTSITQGLKAGQEVVLADLNAALPSGDSTSERAFSNRGSGPGGGGFSGGGAFPGGGGPR